MNSFRHFDVGEGNYYAAITRKGVVAGGKTALDALKSAIRHSTQPVDTVVIYHFDPRDAETFYVDNNVLMVTGDKHGRYADGYDVYFNGPVSDLIRVDTD